jgi:hypothetical protein
MKESVKVICAALIAVVMIAVFVTFSATSSTMPSTSPSPALSAAVTAQDTVLSFIENVLPIDTSRYNTTLKGYHVPSMSSIKGTTEEDVRYTLESDESVIDVICDVINGNVTYCLISVKNGSIISDRQYADIKDSAVSLVEKYQAFCKIDLSDMISMLSDVDPTVDIEKVSGNMKLTISNKGFEQGKSTVISTVLTCGYVYDGCEYPGLHITFRNGVLYGLGDKSRVFTLGNTTVCVSKEQAIAIAMKYIQNYSYKMPDGTWISDFDVAEHRTDARLVPAANGSVLYPEWQVTLYFTRTYPGSVHGLLVGVWAGSGEVASCGHI